MGGIDFIQIGANIGNTDTDIIWKLIRKNSWNGIFIEPMPESYKKLRENYSDIVGSFFENVAIMDYNGDVSIYTKPDDLVDYSEQASAMRTGWWRRNTLEITVPCKTLTSIINQYELLNVPFELLQIDAEGMDGKILLSTDFTNIMPKHIRFESIHMAKDEQKLLLAHLKLFGYEKIDDFYNDLHTKENTYDTMVERMV